MKSEHYVKRMSFLDKENGNVFFEGFLGTLKNVALIEGVMLELEGVNGIIRVDISQKDLEKCLYQKSTATHGAEQQ